MGEIVLAAENLGKTVISGSGTLRLLDDVNFSISQGEAVAIVGPSGAGKSTLLALLAGLDQATEGRVNLLGHDLSEANEDARAAIRAGRVGFVFQSFHLMEGMTALENVQLLLEMAGVDQAQARAKKLLQEVGLEARMHHFPNRLSGGEQQRVALARAFAVEPTLLFADEPTGNLDPETGARVVDLMFRLRDEQGCTLVLITHDSELAARCDRRLRVVDGRLEALQ